MRRPLSSNDTKSRRDAWIVAAVSILVLSLMAGSVVWFFVGSDATSTRVAPDSELADIRAKLNGAAGGASRADPLIEGSMRLFKLSQDYQVTADQVQATLGKAQEVAPGVLRYPGQRSGQGYFVTIVFSFNASGALKRLEFEPEPTTKPRTGTERKGVDSPQQAGEGRSGRGDVVGAAGGRVDAGRWPAAPGLHRKPPPLPPPPREDERRHRPGEADDGEEPEGQRDAHGASLSAREHPVGNESLPNIVLGRAVHELEIPCRRARNR